MSKLLIFCLSVLLSVGAAAERQTFSMGSIRDFMLAAALGNVRHVVQDFIVGVSLDVDKSDGEVTIWDNKFNITPLTGSTELFINSTDAGDTSQIVVSGLDENFIRRRTITALNGLTQVSIGNYRHVQFGSVLVTDAEPAGDVFIAKSTTLTAGVPLDVDVQSKILQGFNITHNGFFMVPGGEVAAVISIRGSASSRDDKSAVFSTHITVDTALLVLRTTQYAFSDFGNYNLPMPVASTNTIGQLDPLLTAGTFVEFKVKVQDNDTEVFFGIDLLYIDEEYQGLVNPVLLNN